MFAIWTVKPLHENMEWFDVLRRGDNRYLFEMDGEFRYAMDNLLRISFDRWWILSVMYKCPRKNLGITEDTVLSSRLWALKTIWIDAFCWMAVDWNFLMWKWKNFENRGVVSGANNYYKTGQSILSIVCRKAFKPGPEPCSFLVRMQLWLRSLVHLDSCEIIRSGKATKFG